MFEDKKLPFYMAYPYPYSIEEREIQKEIVLMKSMYPEAVRTMQEEVERECDMMEYEGSRMYDEYPDHYMLERGVYRIADRTPGYTEELENLLRILLAQEIYQRRCRRKRRRRQINKI